MTIEVRVPMKLRWGGHSFFFSSSVADVALKARSLHENKRECIVQGQKVLWVGKSIEATKTKTTTKPKTTTRKSPSQTCVSPAETAKQTAETKQKPQNGARAQTKIPTESICHWTQWTYPLHHYQKHAKWIRDHGCPGRHEGLSLGVYPSMSQAVHESRATIKPLLESSQINSSMGLHGHSSHHRICQPRSRSRDVEKSDPPLEGEAVMAKGKHRRPGTSFQTCHRQPKKGARP